MEKSCYIGLQTMLIGALSDTHGNSALTARAVQMLARHRPKLLIHCGDVGDVSLLNHLVGFRSAVVWGNTDWDRAGLRQYAKNMGIECYGAFGEIQIDDLLLAVLHGDDHHLLKKLIDEQRHDYIFHGHTHLALHETHGRVQVVNPGALHRASRKTVALVDTQTGQVEFIEVPEK